MEPTPDPKAAIAAILAAAGVTVTFSPPSPGTDPEWPCIVYVASIDGTEQEFRLGVGHVKYPKDVPSHSNVRFTEDERSALYTLLSKPYAKFHDKTLHARLAAKLAMVQKVAPSPVDVIAAMAMDGAARLQTFEDWCADFGYDTDSRKAKKTYKACRKCGQKLLRHLSPAQIEAIRQLAYQL